MEGQKGFYYFVSYVEFSEKTIFGGNLTLNMEKKIVASNFQSSYNVIIDHIKECVKGVSNPIILNLQLIDGE